MVALLAVVALDAGALRDHHRAEAGAATLTDVRPVALTGVDEHWTSPTALVVLDPTGCGALVANGGGQVRVRSVGVHPGRIAVDTDASQCTGGNYGIDVQGLGSSIVAEPSAAGQPGVVNLSGLTQAACNTVDRACDPYDVAFGTLSPQPVPAGDRVGREPVDWRYNCKPDYGSLGTAPCPHPAAEAHVDALRAEIGAAGLPAGYRDYRAEGYACHVGSGAAVTVPAGNWWVNCSLSVRGRLTFTGGNPVFQRGLSIGAGGLVEGNGDNPTTELSPICQEQVAGCADQSSANHAFAYFRSGGIDRVSGGSLHLRNTFVYLHNGGLSLTGGSGTLSWQAPGGYRTAASGPFEGLALWSESTGTHSLSGGSALALGGTFFTPGALFDYSASGAAVRTRAQIVAFRFKATGTGRLELATRAP